MIKSLPVDAVLPELIDVLREHGVAVLQAPPGAGKSTRVPPGILDSGLCEQKIIMLEPRRVAAKSVAMRIASERGQRIGDEIGYAVRFDRKISASTRVEIVTEGLLLRRLQQDPLLEDVDCVILDEFHERSVHADLSLAMLHEVRQVRPELKLVVMSATLQMEPLVRYLDAPAVTSKGRTFPVDVIYKPSKNDIYSGVYDVVSEFATDSNEQDALVFMPGARQIQQTIEVLTPLSQRHGFELFPLYGSLSLDEQSKAIESSDSRRRVIVSTNIAETSLTVEGVTTVIDSGLVKQMRSDVMSGLDRLVEVPVARDSAEQRAGRAGRVRPGRAVRLWSDVEQDMKAGETEPEIKRVDLLPVLLEVIAWSGQDPEEFNWFESPSGARIRASVKLLRQLGLVDSSTFQLTTLGKAARQLPLHPRLSCMLFRALECGLEREVSVAVALLSEDAWSSLSGRTAREESDLWFAMQRYMREGSRVLGGSFYRVQQVVRQISDLLQRFKSDFSGAIHQGNDSPEEAFARCVLAGYPDRVCLHQQSGEGADYIMVGGHVLTLARESRAQASTWLVALYSAGVRKVYQRDQTSGVSQRGIIRLAEPVSEALLMEACPERFEERVEVEFDWGKERFSAQKIARFDGLFLSSMPVSLKGHVGDEELARAMSEVVSRDLVRAFNPDKDELQLLYRVEMLRHHRPDLGLPDLRVEDVARDEITMQLLLQWCWGCKGVSDLRRKGLKSLLMGSMQYDQRQALDELVPARIEVPSGSHMRIDYEGVDTPPVLAVRIQEVFGWQRSPTILGGEVALMCHLLAPNYRPAQVTQDLKSFWINTYPEVRKELRARYPKHAWPEDPLTAQAVKKGASSRR